MERTNNFDALRLLAATLVLVSHCYPLFGREGEEIFWRLTGYETGGGIGVRIFFVISGYLITMSIERRRSWRDYATARALRILPALATVVATSMFVLGPVMTHLSASDYFGRSETYGYAGNAFVYFLQYGLPGVFAELPKNAVNGSLWTLPIEVTMYVLLATVSFSGALTRRSSLFITIAFFVAHVLTQTIFSWNWNNRGPQILHMPLDSILGLGLWFWVGSSYWMCRASIPLSGWLAAAAGVAFAATFHSPHSFIAGIIAIPYLIYYAAHAGAKIHLPFGDISYGVYLYAWPISQTVYELSAGRMSFYVMLIIAIVATYTAAWLSWVLIERPMLNLKRLWTAVQAN